LGFHLRGGVFRLDLLRGSIDSLSLSFLVFPHVPYSPGLSLETAATGPAHCGLVDVDVAANPPPLNWPIAARLSPQRIRRLHRTGWPFPTFHSDSCTEWGHAAIGELIAATLRRDPEDHPAAVDGPIGPWRSPESALSPFPPMSNNQSPFPFYCLALLGATLLAIGAIGAENPATS
jgi:hypothetical protein